MEITKHIILQAIRESKDFVAGASLCSEGEPCPDNASKAMLSGYARQYAIEQQNDFQTNSLGE